MEISETNAPQDLESATARVLKRIASEPAYAAVLYKILASCETDRPAAAIEQEIRSYPEMRAAMQPPQVLLAWLVKAGGLEPVAEQETRPAWRTTPAGRNVVRMEWPGNRLAKRVAQVPGYRAVYHQVLRACLEPKTKGEIESLLRGNPALERPEVSPSYFIGELEKAGGLEWDRKWRTTQAGKEFVNEAFVGK
jgi:hypothetical protein